MSMLGTFSITPLGTGESVGDLVAEAVRIVRESGLPNQTDAMFTNLEGEWDEVIAVIRACVDRGRPSRAARLGRSEAGSPPGRAEWPLEREGGVDRADAQCGECRSSPMTGRA